ncbi:NAD(P)H-binding protein [Levilactobacillus zymae]|uniref:NAD(P)H-binding protein n=1 Tax=Levilactobacillus zymae TaxID=267363 RepID=UPI0028BB0091|nr:NAD(P)H-binding protein [Levilactobacillus zymae]MDT6979487.1 NAD(P)H-binding protein [Levilactobacillus zymae]
MSVLEVAGPFKTWYREHTGLVWQTNYVDTVEAVENSDFDYVVLRTTWLYNDASKTAVDVTKKGEPFQDAQITREAVAKFASDLLTGKEDYHRESLGIGEPNTAWTKPSFY